MASVKKAGRAHWRGIPVAFKVLALCLIALAALLMLLPAPPDNSSGGMTSISRHVPSLRDTVDPLDKEEPRVRQIQIPAPAPAPAQTVAPEPTVTLPALPAPPVAEVQPQPERPEPPKLPLRKPEVARLPASPPAPEWTTPQIQPPVRQEVKREQAPLPAQGITGPGTARSNGAPSKSEIREWIKSQAWEFLGGVDPQGNILYRFEVWLNAPQNVLSRIDSVVYDYDAPSATPKSRESNQVIGGFRARFGALACSKQVTVTLKMTDGSTTRAIADGCQALTQ